jgi:transposase InsO family protein
MLAAALEGRRKRRTGDETRADVFDYIERFYNPRRRHSSLALGAAEVPVLREMPRLPCMRRRYWSP